MDFREDTKNGDIRTSRVHYNQFVMDPYWREMDLSDCNWIWQRTYMDKDTVKALLPSQYDSEIEKNPDPIEMEKFQRDVTEKIYTNLQNLIAKIDADTFKKIVKRTDDS